jgi:hypothetical protein
MVFFNLRGNERKPEPLNIFRPDLEFVLLLTTNPAPRGSFDSANRTGSWQLVEGVSGVVQQTECDDPEATREMR